MEGEERIRGFGLTESSNLKTLVSFTTDLNALSLEVKKRGSSLNAS